MLRRVSLSLSAAAKSTRVLAQKLSSILPFRSSSKEEQLLVARRNWEAIINEMEREENIIWETNKKSFKSVLVAPLLQVFSVSLHSEFEDERPCEVYGSIRAIEEQGSSFSLYDRCHCDPETIIKGGTLSLTGPEPCAILSAVGLTTTLDLCLKDKSRGVTIIDTPYVLHSKTEDIEDSYDKLIKAVVSGRHGFATVYYTTFRFAVFATVMVSIAEKYDNTSPSADIYGSIVAEYANVKPCSKDDSKLMKTVIFDKPSDKSVKTMVRTPIELSRSVVAVPAYATLRIEADLWDSHGRFAGGSAEILAIKGCHSHKCIVGDCGVILVHVFVDGRVLTRKEDYDHIRQQQTVILPLVFRRLGSKPSFSTMSSERSFSTMSSKRSFSTMSSKRSLQLVEVFSVFVEGIKHEITALCGTIKIQHNDVDFIFARGLCNAELLTPRKSILSLQVHDEVDNCGPVVSFYLRDPVQNLEIANGYECWCDVSLRPYYGLSQYDQRLSCLITGEHGYAVMHYMVMKSAYPAVVEVSFSFDDTTKDEIVDVSGSIYARYSGHDYSTDYEKKYFRSRLFDRPREEPVQLTAHSRLPLMKSSVAVPTDSSLIIDADLCITSIGRSRHEVLFGSQEIRTDASFRVCEQIRGLNYRIELSVLFQ